MTRLHGQNIDCVIVSDNAQAHIGDAITVNHYHNAAPLQAEIYDILFESLTFDGMNARVRNVATAFPKTCEWLLRHRDFVAWADSSRIHEHHGFLWVKGKPGSGKSTIMKKTVTWAERTWSDQIVLSYFFNARSPHLLDKSSLGLYRSLLCQLLHLLASSRSVFQTSFDSKVRNKGVDDWTRVELENFFVQLVGMPGLPPIVVFVDALDEGVDDDTRQMVTFLECWTQHAITAGCQLRVCLSSRHYPHISVEKSLSLVIEDQSEHNQDIELYLNSRLIGGKDPEMDKIRQKVRDRSSGIFLWVVLVVPILNRTYDQGKSAAAMLRKLHEIPRDLRDLFDQIILKDDEDFNECVTLLQWVLYAMRPLRPLELYYAIWQTHNLGDNDQPVSITDDEAIRYLRNCSRGLIEMTRTEKSTVQLIHETVRDYLLKNVKSQQTIHFSISAQDFGADACHKKLAEACLHYLLRYHLHSSTLEAGSRSTLLASYAAEYWWQHMNSIAGVCHLTVVQLALELLTRSVRSLSSWNRLYDIMQAKLHQHIEPDNLPPPLHYAACIGRHELVDAVLSLGTDIEARSKRGTALTLASYLGYVEVVQVLLAAGADIEASGRHFYTALQAASYVDQEKVIQILLAAGADLEATGGQNRTALQLASECGRERSVRTLIAAGANLEASNAGSRTALKLASDNGHKGVVLLLLAAGASLEPSRRGYTTALQLASKRGFEGIVRILIKAGADVNSLAGSFGTALQAACSSGADGVVQMLIEAGADLEGWNESHATALQLASLDGHTTIVQMLIDAGADVDSPGPWGTALQNASGSGYERVIRILLDAGADVNSPAGDLGTALQAASRTRYEGIVQMLIDAGADVNCPGPGGTALQVASIFRREGVVEVLKKAGARTSTKRTLDA